MQTQDLDYVAKDSEFYMIGKTEEGKSFINKSFRYVKTGERVARVYFGTSEDPALVFFTGSVDVVVKV